MHEDKNWEKQYREMMNEIIPPEELKRKVRYQSGKHKRNHSIGKLVLAVCMVLVITNMLLWVSTPLKENQMDLEKVEEEIPLQTIGSFENLKKIASKVNQENSREEATKNNATTESLKETKDYSSTNLQEKGVDELDTVKTDGKYVYYIIRGGVHIFDIQNPHQIQEVGKIEKENQYIRGIYLAPNRLVMIYQQNDNRTKTISTDTARVGMVEENYTNIEIYDMVDVHNPILERKIEVKGYFVETRLIGSNLYMITRQFLNKNEIDTANPDKYKPTYRDSLISAQEQIIELDKVYQLEDTEDFAYTSITGVNIEGKEEANVTAFLGMGNNIYCSLDNLYLVKENVEFNEMVKSIDNTKSTSTVYKFALKDSRVKFIAQTEVNGRILNQFSMGEYQGFFRIATTSFAEDSSNNIYIFDSFMKEVGKLENIAPGENIYAARFMKNICYLVTFKQVDPFFIIDLSNITKPEIKGELKIPGYSSYLQSYDENHILGIGYEVNNTKNGQEQGGLKMTMFDVSDKNNPKEMFTQVLGMQGTYSEAIYNHKALLMSKENNILAFPVTINKGKNNYFRGAIVYQIDIEKGFVEKGRITHENSEKQYDSFIERILYVGDNIITVSQRYIKIHDKTTMEEIGSFRQEKIRDSAIME